MDEIVNNPVTVNDSEFDQKVLDVSNQVQQLHNKANEKLSLFIAIIIIVTFILYLDGDDAKMQLQVKDLNNQFENVDLLLKNVDSRLNKIDDKSSNVELDLQRLNSQKSKLLFYLLKFFFLRFNSKRINQSSYSY